MFQRYIIQASREAIRNVETADGYKFPVDRVELNKSDLKKQLESCVMALEGVAQNDYPTIEAAIAAVSQRYCSIRWDRPRAHKPETDEGLPFYYCGCTALPMGKIRAKGVIG